MNSFDPKCWLDRPTLRSYSISMPGANSPARVVSGASCQERRADPIVVLSLISTGWRTGAGGTGTCEHAPKASAATAAARTDVSGVEGFGIVFSPSSTRSGVSRGSVRHASFGREVISRNPSGKSGLQLRSKYYFSVRQPMSQAALLVDVVKRTLRHKGLTYRYVAKGLKLSESSVKRMFARRNLSLARLERICALMNLEIADLLELTRGADARVAELSEKQERELVGNPKLLLVGMLAVSHWTAAEILETYRFSQSELVGLLARLDRLKIIDLLPENRIKVRLPQNFNWRKGGPIQRFFEERVQRQFFESSFLRAGELRVTVHGSLSEKSNGLLQQHMRKLAEEFDMFAEQDKRLAHEMREGTTLVMAMRPWELSMFGELRRIKGHKGAGPIGAERRKSSGG